MSETFDKSQMSESFDVPTGCLNAFEFFSGYSAISVKAKGLTNAKMLRCNLKERFFQKINLILRPTSIKCQ